MIKEVFFTKLFKNALDFGGHCHFIQKIYNLCLFSLNLSEQSLSIFNCTVFETNSDCGFTVIGHEAFLLQYVQSRMKDLRNPSTPGLFSVRLSRLNEIQEEKANIIPYLAWMD